MIRTTYITVLILFFTAFKSYSFIQQAFDTWRNYPFGGRIYTVTSADFNNDSYIDFACGGFNYDRETEKQYYVVNIYINKGDGTYKEPTSVKTIFRISEIFHGDFNNDGLIDILALTDSYNDIEVIMNQGDGIFNWQNIIFDYGSRSLTVLDVDNDGNDDILCNEYGILNIYFSNGDGSFAIGDAGEDIITIPIDLYGTPLSWDVNHDDKEDLLIWGFKLIYTDSINYYIQPLIATYVNNADTTFQPAVEYLYGDSGSSPIHNIRTGYFNADAETDLLIADTDSNRVILTNDGDGSFIARTTFKEHFHTQIAVGDVNNDNYSDLIFPESENAAVLVKLNDASDNIAFSDSAYYAGKSNTNPNAFTPTLSVDVNNDNYADIIQYDWTMSAILNKGDGTFPVFRKIENIGDQVYDFLVEDFNGNGFPDILTIGKDSINIITNNGSGLFSKSWHYSGAEKQGIFSGYFDNDNLLDFGMVSPNSCILYYNRQNDGFEMGSNIVDTLDSFYGGFVGMAVDFNNDDLTDLVTAYGGGYNLNILLSDSAGRLNVTSYGLGGVIQTDIDTADIDNDGDLDVVVSSHNNDGSGGAISFRYNDGNGNFPVGRIISTELYAMGVVFEDFNNDNLIDIAATHSSAYDGYVSVYFNNGDSTFSAAENWGQLYAPAYRQIESVDIDSDGDFDILATNTSYNELVVLFNDGTGRFPDIHYYPGGEDPKAFAITSFDNDSTMDIAVLSSDWSYQTDNDYVYIFSNTWGDPLMVELSQSKSDRHFPELAILYQNYPNPFNPTTTIEYTVGTQHKVSVQVNLSIYNLLGQKVVTLVSKKQAAGSYQVPWNASSFSTGIYYYQLSVGDYHQVKKMVIIK